MICWVLSRLTGMVPSWPDSRKLVTEQADDDWFAEGQFIAGQFTPVGAVAAQLSAEGVQPIFLVRNIFDLLIDQYRYFSRESSNFDHRYCPELSTAEEGIALLIFGFMSEKLSLTGLGIWSRQMQEMLRFSTRHPSCVLSYEKLLHEPAGQIKQLADFLGIELTVERLDELVIGLSREIQAKTGGNPDPTAGYRYGLSCEFQGMLADFHFYMIKNMLITQAPDLGSLSAVLGFPEVTAQSSDLLRLERIFVSTVFKSGTKLLGHIIERVTGLSAKHLGMEVGSDYESADPIAFESGKFFIWHNVPSASVKARIRAENAKPIFLIRNIYDLVVSQYFHFADDVDAATGHSTGTAPYFASLGRDEGISLLLCGATSEWFHWHGFGYYLRQIQEILRFSKEYPCHVVVYDRLVLNKRHEIERLTDFLGIEVPQEIIRELLDSSTLGAMREARIALVGSGKHFRKGTPGDHVNELKPQHYHMINHLKLVYAPDLDALCDELGLGDVTATPPEASMPVIAEAVQGLALLEQQIESEFTPCQILAKD